MSVLCAVLCSPPLTTGHRTTRHLEVAASLLECEATVICNLFAWPTSDLPEINSVGQQVDGWLEARRQMAVELEKADKVLLGWGISRLAGPARLHQRAQIQWVATLLNTMSTTSVWCAGEQPRHPSRWHQFVSDRYGRTRGGNFRQRLSEVLTRVTLTPEGKVICDVPATRGADVGALQSYV